MKTHGRLIREELNESYEHLRQAAAHAAGGTADLVGPRLSAARRTVRPGLRRSKAITFAAVVPLAVAAKDSAKTAGKVARKGKAKVTRENNMQRKRWPMLFGGLLVAGAAAGVAGAAIARRRADSSRWEEYGTTPTSGTRDDAKAMVDSGVDKVHSMADSAKDRASDLMSGSKTESRSSGGSTTGLGTNPVPTSTHTSPSTTSSTASPSTTTSGASDYSSSGTASKNSRP